MKQCTIYVKTDQGYWGIGSTLNEAMENAKVKRGHFYTVQMWSTPKSNVELNNKGLWMTKDGKDFDSYEITGEALQK